jgi:VanZ family protein
MISYLSLVSSQKLDAINSFPFEDKGAHMFAYAVLGVFLYFSFVRVSFALHHDGRDILASNWIILPSLFTVLLGIIIGTVLEFVQKTVGREFEVLDIVSDGLGLIVGCTIGFYILKAVIKIAMKRNY